MTQHLIRLPPIYFEIPKQNSSLPFKKKKKKKKKSSQKQIQKILGLQYFYYNKF